MEAILELHSLKPAPGSRKRKKRLGCGRGSGHGATSTRGMKGQKAHSGEPKPNWFEGGQMPLLRRIPKRGFTNKVFKKVFSYINLSDIDKKFKEGEAVNPETLLATGLIKTLKYPVKILGDGNVTKALEYRVNGYSQKAQEKIKISGGKIL
ncbi:MAG: 50S ribosomal protein L15 [Elusimicrobiota bacterium]